MKTVLSFAFFLAISPLFSQVKPAFFPEEITQEGVEVRCYCKPGIRNKSRSKGLDISYTWLGNGVFRPEEEANTVMPPLTRYKNWEQVEVDLKAPVVNSAGFKLILCYKYRTESFEINRLGADFSETFRELGANNLKNNSLTAILTKPLNETKYLALRLRYTANGNYEGIMSFKSKYSIYKAMAFYGVKPNEDFEWGFGLGLNHSFRRTTILPYVLYNRNFSPRWGIESALPGYVFARWNLRPGSIFLFGVEYNSESYRLDVILPNDLQRNYAMNHSELIGLCRLEQQFAPWIWGNLKMGYQMNFSTDFMERSAATIPFQVEPSDGIFFQVGIFISPPDELLNRN